MTRLMTIAALAAGLNSLFNFAHADPSKPASTIDPVQSCSRDLAALPDFLMANDTGAADNRRHRGEAAIASALERATRETESVKSSNDCTRVLQRYLAAWREGHLAVESVVKAPDGQKSAAAVAPPPEAPADIRWLGNKTVLLTFRTFDPSAEVPIRDLFKTHQKRLEQVPNWIIDVRQNSGGSDSTYEPIVQAVIGNTVLLAGQ